MASNILTDPPMLPTDLPTQEVFFQGADSHRYIVGGILNAGNVSMIDVGLIPNGFAIPGYARGLAVAYLTQGSGSNGSGTLRVALHRPGTKLSDYQTNWLQVPDIFLSSGAGNFFEGTTWAKIASQRQGEFVYVFGHASISYFDFFIVWKVTRSEYVQTVYSETDYLSPLVPALHIGSTNGEVFVSDDEQPFIWHTYGLASYAADIGNSNAWVLGFTDDGTPLGTEQYVNDFFPSFEGFVYSYGGPGTGWNFTGKTGAFKQKVFLPPGQYGFGPILVHPWACGSYGAPELWFFLTEFDTTGQTTGRYNIYHSTWGRGNYVRYDNLAPTKPLGYVTEIFDGYSNPPLAVDPTTFNYHPHNARTASDQPIVLTDDPAFMSHTTLFPKANPQGYAFQTNWFRQANFVGTVGPFDCGVYNPRGTPTATAQNAAYTHDGGLIGGDSPLSVPSFKLLRDPKHLGTVHLVVADGGQHPQEDQFTNVSYNGAWHATSSDDGHTWSDPIQLIPGSHGSEAHVEKSLLATGQTGFGVLAAVRTFDDATLIATGYRKAYTELDGSTAPLQSDSGVHAAFAALDYQYSGSAGTPGSQPVIFRRGEARGAVWQ